MLVPITIPFSTFELNIAYERAIIKLLAERTEIVQGLFDALIGCDPKIDDIEVINAGKTSEQGIKFALSSKRISFFFGAASCRFVKEAARWAEADEIMRILDICLAVLGQHSEVEFGKKNTILTLHLQLKTDSFKDVLRRFISPVILQLDAAPSEAIAIVSRWPKRSLTLDVSAAIANGIFVQTEREFSPDATSDDIKRQIVSDEDELFSLLGVKEVDG